MTAYSKNTHLKVLEHTFSKRNAKKLRYWYRKQMYCQLLLENADNSKVVSFEIQSGCIVINKEYFVEPKQFNTMINTSVQEQTQDKNNIALYSAIIISSIVIAIIAGMGKLLSCYAQ